MADAIAKGDVIMLKSGGPAMTVSRIESGRAVCDWFVGDERHVQSFDSTIIMPDKRPRMIRRIVLRNRRGPF
jgi:uncharacterized protein YodC (DUF2158 family)